MSDHNAASVQPDPAVDVGSFGGLPAGVKNWLTHALLRVWPFEQPPSTHINTDRHYSDGTWIPAPQSHPNIPFSKGGNAMVHVWVCVDHKNTILDRVVVKNVFPGVDDFDDPDHWSEGTNDEPLESEVSAAIHQRLETHHAGDQKHVAQCLGYGDIRNQAPDLPQFKLYFEYELGSLASCIEAQGAGEKMIKPPGRLKRKKVNYQEKPFHEGFLWVLFEALAKVAIGMDEVGIVHGDIHPGNILFGTPDPAHYAIWPVPKLGDFGSARIMDENKQVNRATMSCWLDSSSAPEMDWKSPSQLDEYTIQSFRHWDPTLPPRPGSTRPGNYVQRPVFLTSATNIWQIGLLMLNALRLEVTLPETDWRSPPPGYNVPASEQVTFATPGALYPKMGPRLNAQGQQRYSRQLLTTIRKCLRFDPEARITPQQLLVDVQRLRRTRDGGMRQVTGKFPWNHPLALRMSLNDKYKVGKKPYKPARVR